MFKLSFFNIQIKKRKSNKKEVNEEMAERPGSGDGAHNEPEHFDTERGFEILGDEFFKSAMGNLYNNMKRTYDEYQDVSLQQNRKLFSATTEQNQQLFSHLQKVLSDAQENTNFERNISRQALQNAVETANMVGKQAVRHNDVAIDRQWNLEPSEGAAQNQVLSPVAIEALKAAVVSAITDLVKTDKVDTGAQ
jgi:hypothetical protein